MDNKILIQKLIQEILASNNVDEKREKRNKVVTLFKESRLVECTPVVVRLNTMLALKEAIDSFIVHDNPSSREILESTYTIVSQLLCDNCQAA